MEIRLNKLISDTGFCSRRQADTLIESGRVKVNGQIALMGQKITATDVVLIDGQPIQSRQKRIYIALNKPVGITCTTDTREPDNIIDFVNYPLRIFPIGRLDKPSEGLILLTSDGDIVNKILRAGNSHEKEYEVTVDRPINEGFVSRMRLGVPILGTMTKPCRLLPMGSHKFKIILTQGLNRQIRRMCEYLGYEVVTLKRTRIMHITLHNLRVGEYRLLTDEELKQLEFSIADSDGSPAASKGAGAPKREGERKNTIPNSTSKYRSRGQKSELSRGITSQSSRRK